MNETDPVDVRVRIMVTKPGSDKTVDTHRSGTALEQSEVIKEAVEAALAELKGR